MSQPPPLAQLSLCVAELRGSNLRGRNPEEISATMGRLLDGYNVFNAMYTEEDVFCRGRKCRTPQGFSNLSELIYPSPAGQHYGRAHVPGAQVLYASANKRIVLDEIGAMAGDYVQVIGLRARSGMSLPFAIVGEYQSVLNSGRPLFAGRGSVEAIQSLFQTDPANVQAMLYVDSFLAEVYRREAARPWEYMITALFAEQVNKTIGGVLYESVQTVGGMNAAIPALLFDSSCEVLFTELLRVDRYYGFGVYDTTHLNWTNAFLSDGAIDWEGKTSFAFDWSMDGGINISPGTTGWRKR